MAQHEGMCVPEFPILHDIIELGEKYLEADGLVGLFVNNKALTL